MRSSVTYWVWLEFRNLSLDTQPRRASAQPLLAWQNIISPYSLFCLNPSPNSMPITTPYKFLPDTTKEAPASADSQFSGCVSPQWPVGRTGELSYSAPGSPPRPLPVPAREPGRKWNPNKSYKLKGEFQKLSNPVSIISFGNQLTMCWVWLCGVYHSQKLWYERKNCKRKLMVRDTEKAKCWAAIMA